jgi:probable HAF family extracellular repeat protein
MKKIVMSNKISILALIMLMMSTLLIAATASAAQGTWNMTGSLAVARRDHKATLLTNGKVLVVGYFTTYAELYDPTTGTFSATGAMLVSHGQGATATRLSDGRVLVVGGNITSVAEIYDPNSGIFSAVSYTATPRSFHTATLLPDGRVLIAGGKDASGNSSAVAELYNPASGIFSVTGSLNVDRMSASAALLPDGRVLVAGGSRTTGLGIGECLSSAELYNPATGTFSITGSMVACRDLGTGDATVLRSGKVLFAGGNTAAGLASAELFDPVTGTFSPTGSMTVPRASSTMTLLSSGMVLVAGGSTATGPVTTNSADLYDPATGIFTATASMAIARQEHTATLLLNGKVLVTGGYNPTTGDLSSSELYTTDAPSYLVKDLGTLGGTNSLAYGINNSGWVTGYADMTGSTWTSMHAFLYDGTTMRDLGTLGGSNSKANGINDSGWVVGYAYIVGDTTSHAFLYDGTTMRDLNSLTTLPTGAILSSAVGINDAGQIAGEMYMGNGDSHAYLYSGGTVTDLGTLGGSYSEATGINNSGWVVGNSYTASYDLNHVFLYDGTTMRDLGAPYIEAGGFPGVSVAYGMNDIGQIVGFAYFPGMIRDPFLYSGGVWTDLGNLGGRRGWANGINSSGQVVGMSPDVSGDQRLAFLYSGGVMYDLNNLISSSSGLVLTDAFGINDAGQIVGWGTINGALHAYLLTPGAVTAVTEGLTGTVALGPQIDLTFSSVASGGSVTATMILPGTLSAPPNFSIVGGTSYDITTDASFNGQVQVCIGYDQAKITVNEQLLRLYHYSGGTWTNITLLPVDTVNNRVCGLTSSFSVFAVAESTTVFHGFFSPVDNPPVVNNAKAGQSIPVIWRLTKANGLPISDPASFKNLTSSLISCGNISGNPVSPVEEYSAGSSGLRYSGDGYWQFNWKSPKTYAGQCSKMVLTLGDGSTHEAEFKFK